MIIVPVFLLIIVFFMAIVWIVMLVGLIVAALFWGLTVEVNKDVVRLYFGLVLSTGVSYVSTSPW